MIATIRRYGAVMLAVLLLLPGGTPLRAQDAGQPPAAPAEPSTEPVDPVVTDPADPAEPGVAAQAPAGTPEGPPPVRRREVVRVGQDVSVLEGEAVREVVVVFGHARVAGEVDRDLVVVMGSAELLGTGSVGGSLVVVGGSATITPGARVDGDMVVVGGAVDAPADFRPGREHVVIGVPMMGTAVMPWINRGLLWGRPLVPDLAWMWTVVAVLFLVYAALTLLFERPIRLTAATLEEKPLTVFGVGVLVMVLAGPVTMLLMITVIGVALVPFLMVGLFAVAVVGRVATARWIGMRLMPEDDTGNRLVALRSLAIGFVLLCIAYVIPVVGFLVWLLVGIVGVGAGTLALMAAYRRENPPPARPEPAVVAPPPPPAPYTTPLVPSGQGIAPLASSEAGPDAGVPPGIAMPAAPPAPGPLPPVAPAVVDLLPYPRAGFGDRVAAGLLDVILVAIVVGMLRGQGNVFVLLLLVYLIGFWAWKGTTVGGIICQLRIVRMDGRRLEFLEALVRGLSSLFSLVVLGLGFFWILRDPERQAWHDKIAGTFVVKVPRHVPL
jgi:uncharacterized RDD family membrane protein YckC